MRKNFEIFIFEFSPIQLTLELQKVCFSIKIDFLQTSWKILIQLFQAKDAHTLVGLEALKTLLC